MLDLRPLGHSGLLVSPLTLGTMTMGNPAWGSDDSESGAVLDRFLEAGGNAIDTADVYSGGASEEMVGRLVAERGIRDGVVIATKYGFAGGVGPVSGGAGRAIMARALEGSLQRLGTDYVDLYWMHLWDGFTPAAEVVHAMSDLVRAGKIRYYGLSNTPAWFAAQAVTIAREQGLPAPVALQLEYSLVARDIEREHVTAARQLGLGLVPWSPLAGGFLSGKYHREAVRPAGAGRLAGENPFGDSKFTDRNWAVLDVLREVAAATARTPADVAMSWLLGRAGIGSVLVGARTAEQLASALHAADQALPTDAVKRLDAVSAPRLGYPYDIFTDQAVAHLVGGGRPVRRHP